MLGTRAHERSPTTYHLSPTTCLEEDPPVGLRFALPAGPICFEPGISYSLREIRRFLGIATADGLVADVDGTIAGFVIGYLTRGSVAHVVTLDVHPSHRRRSLGTALLEELLNRFSRAGAREARLEVATGNTVAIAFYRKLGFQRRRRIPGYYGRGRDAFEMELKLESSP